MNDKEYLRYGSRQVITPVEGGAANEYISGRANTHTFVDVIVTGGLILAGIGATPAFAFGLAATGFAYGAFSAIGGSDLIDNLSSDLGKKILYSRKK